MPTVVAKCHNYTGCLRAYRGEEIETDPGKPQVCPECGKPLTTVKRGSGAVKQFLPFVMLAVVLIAVALFVFPVITGMLSKGAAARGKATPSPAPPHLGGAASAIAPLATPGPSTVQPSEPPATITPPARIDMDLAKAENKRVKEEVLTRIDLMPKVSQANKDKLYNSVERARSMGLVLTIPFGSGKIALSPAEIQILKAELDKPDIMRLRDDPTAVFVVLGYADPKGDEKKNFDISQSRAEAVLDAMRDRCGVNNLMHAVAMGGSTLHDARALEKNRVVEVWAALP
jgi:outer membrane protein OmpA-like peptidoglycan-associated protein